MLGYFFSNIKYIFNKNTIKGSKKNIEAHYDLGNNFYKIWLDKSLTYSSALFLDSNNSLYQAQVNKYKRISEILKNGMDKAPPKDKEDGEPVQDHKNVRGSDYYVTENVEV